VEDELTTAREPFTLCVVAADAELSGMSPQLSTVSNKVRKQLSTVSNKVRKQLRNLLDECGLGSSLLRSHR